MPLSYSRLIPPVADNAGLQMSLIRLYNNEVYVFDTHATYLNRILVYSVDGTFSRNIPTYGVIPSASVIDTSTGIIYVGGTNGDVVAINADGTKLWYTQSVISGHAVTDLMVFDGKLWAISQTGSKIARLNLSTGAQLDITETETLSFYGPFAITNDGTNVWMFGGEKHGFAELYKLSASLQKLETHSFTSNAPPGWSPEGPNSSGHMRYHDGLLLVAYRDTVYKYNLHGIYDSKVSIDNFADSCTGFDVDGDGKIWWTTGTDTFSRYNTDGTTDQTISVPTYSPGVYNPQEIIVYNGAVYVVDVGYANDRILVYDLHGNKLREWNVPGITGMAISAGLIYAATQYQLKVYNLYGVEQEHQLIAYGATAAAVYDHYLVLCYPYQYQYSINIEDLNGVEAVKYASFESGSVDEYPIGFIKLTDATNPSTGITNTGLFVIMSSGRLRELVKTEYPTGPVWSVSSTSIRFTTTTFTTPPRRMVRYNSKIYAPDPGSNQIRVFELDGTPIEVVNTPGYAYKGLDAIAAYNNELYIGMPVAIQINSIDNTQITIAPTTATVTPGDTQDFDGVVTGTPNTGVSYYLDEGNAGGRVDADGLYYPPNHGGMFHLVAQADADRTVEARATITVPDPAIRFRAASTLSADAGNTSFSISKPAGTLVNDLLLAKVVCFGDVTPPAGWTHILDAGVLTASGIEAQFGTGAVVQYFYKIATENEPSSYQFQKAEEFNVIARVISYVGVNVANTIAQSLKLVGTAPENHEIIAPEVTTTGDLSTLILDFNCIGKTQAIALDINDSVPLHLTKRVCATDQYSLSSDLWADMAVITPSTITGAKLTTDADSYDVAVAIVLNPTEPGVTVTPSTAAIYTNESQQFQAIVVGLANPNVTWAATGGSIDANGLYTAPNSPGTYTITATSVSDPTKSGTATVTVSTPVPTITISPNTATVRSGESKAFTASTKYITNGEVRWSVQEDDGGTITQDGGYTAPTSTGTFHVVAYLFEEGGVVPVASDTATITVVENTGITVAIDPPSSSVAAGGTVQFSASVRNAQGQLLANQGVVWAVVQADSGTIDSTGLYTAPSKKAGVFQITATSVVDTAAVATATVTVSYTPVTITVTPNPVLMGAGQQQQFTADVAGTIYTSVVWSVKGGAAGGTITQSGLYTSPEVAGVYHVRATLASDPTVYGEATVTVTIEKTLYTETTIIGMSTIDSDGLSGTPLYTEATIISNNEAKAAVSNALEDACIWVAGIAAYSGVDIQSPIITEEGWYTGENYQKETDYKSPAINIPEEYAYLLAFFTVTAEAGDNAKYEFLWYGPEGYTERLAYFYDEDKTDAQNNDYTLFHGIYMADKALTAPITDEHVQAHSIDFDQQEPEEGGGVDEEEEETGHLNACYVSAEIIALRPAVYMGGSVRGTAGMGATMGTPVSMPGGTAQCNTNVQAKPFGFPKALEGGAIGSTDLRATLGTPIDLSGSAAGNSGTAALFGFEQSIPGGVSAGASQVTGGQIVTLRPLSAGRAQGVTYIASANMTLVSDQTITITIAWKRKGIKNS